MLKKKTIKHIEQVANPQALVTGSNTVAGYISRLLQEKGCQVEAVETLPSSLKKFDYIFQFGRFDLLEELFRKYLKKNGKFIFVEMGKEEIGTIPGGSSIRIIRIGDPKLWNLEKLSKKILKTMFASKISAIVDERRKTSASADFEKKKQDIFPKQDGKDLKKEKPSSLIERKILSSRFSFKRALLALGAALILSIVISVAGIYYYTLSLEKTFTQFSAHLASSDFQSVSDDLKKAKKKLNIANRLYQKTSNLFPFLESISYIKEIGEVLGATNDLVLTGEDSISFLQKFRISDPSLLPGSLNASSSDIRYSVTKINNLTKAISSTKKKINSTTLPFFPKEDLSLFLDKSYDRLTALNLFLPLFDKFFLSPTQKTYLVLLQNNMELRPTGGFIGSFALLTAGGGGKYNFKIMDVYDSDGQLKGHVDPPVPIRKYLNQPHWFLRDSNFDPDFATSAVKASWFLEKELKIKVDGVIGINLFVVQNLLRAVGPITISDFDNEVITSDNFFFKAQFFSQNDFFAGSTQKKDFLTAVSKELELKLVTGRSLPWFELISIVKSTLDEKDIIFYSFDGSVQKLIEERGWGGRIAHVDCSSGSGSWRRRFSDIDRSQSCYADYLSIVEANLGVNKVNYFVNKSVTIEKKINREGKIFNTVIISYENKSISQIFHGGTYANYLRLFVPRGSRLVSVLSNNKSIDFAEVDIEAYGTDKTTFGFLVKIPPEGKRTVKISYELPKLFAKESRYYQFFYQKQSGDKTSPLVLSLHSPAGITLDPVNFNSTSSREQEVFYTTDTSVDRVFAFSKKE